MLSHPDAPCWCVLSIGALLAAPAAPVRAGDAITITLDAAVRDTPATGRVILYLIDPGARQHRRSRPADGPFWDPPQPMYSIGVAELEPGTSVVIDAAALASGVAIDDLSGKWKLQAALDADPLVRTRSQGTGNGRSDVIEVDFRPGVDDAAALTIAQPPRHRSLPPDSDVLRWVEIESPLLSAHYGRRVTQRAGVALPPGYDDPASPDRHWATIYEIPGFGGNHRAAIGTARMLHTPGVEDIAPMAVHVVLDPDGPLGHHGFCDSAANGPRGRALVEEFIPALESRFRLVAEPAARITTGHSSGGWSSLWLALEYPGTFGACWSTAPDPVDFTAFQMSDIYGDANMFVDRTGAERPSYRVFASADTMRVAMTVREERAMEYVIAPDGTSGEQWDAWRAMFSPLDPATGLPRPMFDPRSGVIDRAVAEHWSRYDIALNVRNDWERYGPLLTERVRLACGGLDSFYLDRAVHRLADLVRSRAGAAGDGPGYILVVPDETHDTLRPKLFQRINAEMRDHLARHGL